MKTILRVTLLFVFAAFANTLMASGNLKVNIQPLSADKAVIAISSLTESNLKITLEDRLGQIVYYKEVAEPTGDYKKIYDFSELEAGSYKLSVKSDKLTAERSFEIKNWKIDVGDEKIRLEPFFGYQDGIVRCSYLNFPKENLTLYFFDKQGLLYSKEIGRNFTVCEALDLSKLEKGIYEVVLSTGDKRYTYPIKIN
ncbi:MAG TPA: hypothetical protein DCR40_13160 [Prolixibacteraceae bacterium]|nr:hypothetical protein [Prolixibacteraceae bacterium]